MVCVTESWRHLTSIVPLPVGASRGGSFLTSLARLKICWFKSSERTRLSQGNLRIKGDLATAKKNKDTAPMKTHTHIFNKTTMIYNYYYVFFNPRRAQFTYQYTNLLRIEIPAHSLDVLTWCWRLELLRKHAEKMEELQGEIQHCRDLADEKVSWLLPETSLKERKQFASENFNGWKMNFLLVWPVFSGIMLVSWLLSHPPPCYN